MSLLQSIQMISSHDQSYESSEDQNNLQYFQKQIVQKNEYNQLLSQLLNDPQWMHHQFFIANEINSSQIKIPQQNKRSFSDFEKFNQNHNINRSNNFESKESQSEQQTGILLNVSIQNVQDHLEHQHLELNYSVLDNVLNSRLSRNIAKKLIPTIKRILQAFLLSTTQSKIDQMIFNSPLQLINKKYVQHLIKGINGVSSRKGVKKTLFPFINKGKDIQEMEDAKQFLRSVIIGALQDEVWRQQQVREIHFDNQHQRAYYETFLRVTCKQLKMDGRLSSRSKVQ